MLHTFPTIRRSIIPALFVLLLLPGHSYGATILLDANIQTRAEIVSFLNIALFITALISIKQFFWPGDNNTLPFQVFNMIFAVLFYAISLPFLISHRYYYEQYQQLATPLDVLGKFFLSVNISSFAQLVIIASVVINILYIFRFRTDYFQAGVATTKVTPQAIMAEGRQEGIEEMKAEIRAEEEDAKEDVLPYKSSELNDEEIEEIEKASAEDEDDITKKEPQA